MWFPLTGMVPAAAGGAASPPHAVELHGVPVAEAVVTQSVGCQVTDLQPRKLPQKITEGHPVGWKQSLMVIVHEMFVFIKVPFSHISPKLPIFHVEMRIFSI